jgi:3-hydroxyisobutyrate dehydrogenase-like beta-hydroxyacid dehydrogenase
MTVRAGFVGIGKMGEPMAVRLAAVGLETTVYDDYAVADESRR